MGCRCGKKAMVVAPAGESTSGSYVWGVPALDGSGTTEFASREQAIAEATRVGSQVVPIPVD